MLCMTGAFVEVLVQIGGTMKSYTREVLACSKFICLLFCIA